jgi:Family of unknown function (DUF6065)
MKLIAYTLEDYVPELRPAPVERDWMNAAGQWSYRCLPLNIANAYGWEILSPSAFSAIWDGNAAASSIKVQPRDSISPAAVSHFGHGVLTFHVPCVFRTEDGFDLLVQGPPNRPKDAISPLSGIIETDWAPYTFTMNWVFTRPRTEVQFERGEPFCHLFPLKRGEVESFDPELRKLCDCPELHVLYQNWDASRSHFIEELRKPGSQARAKKWGSSWNRVG